MKIRDFIYMWKWSNKYVNNYKIHYFALIILMLIQVFLSLIQINFIQSCIDAVLDKNWYLISGIIFSFLMVIFIGITRNFLSGYISNYINVNVNKSIKNEYMKNITKIEIGTIEGESSGDLITKHNEDIGAALGFIQNAYTNLLVNPLMAISGLIYLCFYSWQLSLVVFIPVPVLSIILNYMSTRAGRIHNIRMQDIGEYTEYLSDTYNGVVTIKANNIQKKMIDKISNSLQKLYKTNCRYSANGSVTLGLILAVGYIPSLTALIYGGTLVLSGVISVSVLFAFNQLIDVVSTPGINIFSLFNELKNSLQSMKRLDIVFNFKKERENGEKFKISEDELIGNDIIRFDNVKFGYSENSLVLSDVSFAIKKNEFIGLIGESGAGKSTIVNLITGFGNISGGEIDILGHNREQWDLEEMRSHIAYVSQDTYLLPGTLKENIRYGRINATDEEINKAVKQAKLDEFVNTLPDCIDTQVNQNGVNFSGGQRQRISLARAFLRDAQLLIFDEPTSSLDSETQELVMENLILAAKSKTCIYISHMVHSLSFCDRIMKIESGKLIECDREGLN